jgi:chromosome segregation ATPase
MQPLTGAIADINRLTAELADVETQIQDAESDRQGASQALQDAFDQRNRTLGNADRLPEDAAAAAKAEAQAAVKAAGQREQDVNVLLEALRTRRTQIKAALDGVRGASVADLLAIQARLDEAKAHAAKIADLIAQRSAYVKPVTRDHLEALDDERGRILAAIALGEADVAELEEAETQLEAAVRAFDTEQDHAGKAHALIQGLQKRLSEAEAEVQRLRAEHKQALALYLKGEQDQHSGDFADKAVALFRAFGDLLGVSRLLGAPETGWRLEIPELIPGQAKAISQVDDADFRDAATALMRQRMADKGIILNP